MSKLDPIALIIWSIMCAIFVGLLGGCARNPGYSVIDCDNGYFSSSVNQWFLERDSFHRYTHMRCIDGLNSNQNFDGLDRKRVIQPIKGV